MMAGGVLCVDGALCKIIRVGCGFYTIRFADSDVGIKVKGHRLFANKEEAEESLPKKETHKLL